MLKIRVLVSALATAGLSSGCGGWWDGDPFISMSGVVAKGAALGGASVLVKCATGVGSAVTEADGSYTLSIVRGALPCVLEAEAADKSLKLYSAIAGAASASSVTANVTPLTTLMVAQATGTDPATFFADSSAIAALSTTVTSATLSAAQTAVIDTLKTAGIDTTRLTDLVAQPLVAAVSGITGNGYDQALDALNQALSTAGVTLGTLTSTLVTTSPANTTSTASAASEASTTSSSTTTSPLPAGLLLQAKAANCDSLRSGTYRVVSFAPRTSASADPVANAGTVTLDATTLKAVWNGTGTSETWSAHVSDKCRFTTPGRSDIVVSAAGVLAMRTLGTESGVATARAAVGFPEQTLAPSDLAGTWNSVGWAGPSSGTRTWNLAGRMTTFALDSSGAMTSQACADDALSTSAANCQVKTTQLPRFTAHASGGFSVTPTSASDGSVGRAFVYRAGNGTLMMVTIDGTTGDFSIATKTRSVALPSVGQSSTQWNVNVNANQLGTDVVSGNTWTAKSADSTTNRYVRSTVASGSDSGTAQEQTIVVNQSRDGYSQRLVTTGTSPNGNAYTVREFYALGVPWLGISGVIVPRTNASTANSNAVFVLSVAVPSGGSIAAPLSASTLLSTYVSGTTWNKAALAYMPLNPSGLIGAWSLDPNGAAGAQTFFFFANGEYVMVDPVGDTVHHCGGPGIERGTFSFNGRLSVSATTDTNLCAGLNDTENPANTGLRSLVFSSDGMSATATGNGGDVTPIYRILR